MTADANTRFDEGATAVRRHAWNGKVWTAAPYRVLQDTDEYFVVAGWPGLKSLASTTWITSFLNGGSRRGQTIDELASGRWELGWWTWRGTIVRSWYGIDTFDLLLDLIVEPDLSRHRWKDEDEYRHGRRLGLIDDQVHRHVSAARDEVVGLVETGQGPFACDWSAPAHELWQTPTLPADALKTL
ncbi:hypothetical protein [Nonomuraea jabiensis]|uniref:hypothetical protein n=1 Tax=Nonomuraea jabiensis TaxID=882448 RepID=UPI003D763A8B